MSDDLIKEGKLTGVSEDEIEVEEKEAPAGKGRSNKAITKQIIIQFNQIKHATVLITF